MDISKLQNSVSDKTLLFVNKAKLRHNNYYNYSKAKYINAKTKILIICPIHGEFEQIPRKHLNGQKCPKCASSHTNDHRKLETNEFIKRAISVHGSKYDYTKTIYYNSTTKLNIICKKHGLFTQYPHSHLRGHGCKKCSTFDKKYSIDDLYKLTKFNLPPNISSIDGKIEVMCDKHGSFTTTGRRLLDGLGCKKCGHDNAAKKHSSSNKKWRDKAMQKYGDVFDFSNTDFSKPVIEVVCRKHGKLVKNRKSFLSGNGGCTQCGIDKLSENNNMGVDEFVKRSIELHKDRYDYSKVKYVNQMTDVIIICPDHGEFAQKPKNHLRGQGCQICQISSGHLEVIDFIKSTYNGNIIINDRNAISPFEIDVFMPDIKFGVEFHGIYYHSFGHRELAHDKLRHHNKANIAADAGITMFQIFETEWRDRKDIVKSMINNAIGLSNRIYARNCKIAELNKSDYINFMNNNHLSKFKHSDVMIGLIYNDNLVSAVGFSRHVKYEWEIARFASLLNTVVVGGFSRLLSYFVKTRNPSSIMTYADRRYSVANCYLKSGFALDNITKPNYFYTKGSKLYSRIKFQKHKLKGLLDNFDPNLSEPENMFLNGYRRIWDAGHYKLIKAFGQCC